ncbi:hypothetical protein LWI28_003246 [Acer negundo]|uniref:Uncharacterized protein n=1 Tax=Acer negundo TaxID=4023 RepID=A0AAD5NPF3_ACENE|nr:hypothetical protein LWI28_003246 [Acer negundo]
MLSFDTCPDQLTTPISGIHSRGREVNDVKDSEHSCRLPVPRGQIRKLFSLSCMKNRSTRRIRLKKNKKDVVRTGGVLQTETSNKSTSFSVQLPLKELSQSDRATASIELIVDQTLSRGSFLLDIDNALNKVPEHLAVEERRRYTESCFGHLLRMDRWMKFSTGIVHRLLIHELHHDGPEDEMRFQLGRHSVRFSKVEFCLITGLKFGELSDTSTYDMVENGIHQWYFEGRDEVEYAELKVVLWIGVFSEQ